MANPNPPDDAKIIEINGRIIDPNKHYASDARNTDHIVVSVRDTLSLDQKNELAELGVEFVEDLGDKNFLCRYKKSTLEPLRELKFIQQVDVYRNLYKIPADLKEFVEQIQQDSKSAEEVICAIDVLGHQNVSDMNALAEQIIEKTDIARDSIQVLDNKVRIDAPIDQLEAIAALRDVRILEEVVQPTLYDSQALQIISAPLKNPGMSAFKGKNQVVAVVDTGFDTGSLEDCHPAFTDRVKDLIPVGRASMTGDDAAKVNDPQGHGTHVCGTIVGREIETSQGLVGGVAPDARIVLSSLLINKRDLVPGPDVRKLLEIPNSTHQAYVHSNSWGDGLTLAWSQRPYSPAAFAIDAFVCDKPDALVIFSAGNNNDKMTSKTPKDVQKPSIGSHAAAKNCLTVGASGSTRVFDNVKSVKKDQMCTDSSRGPTKERRIKPDVVAPGYNVFSAHSRDPGVTYDAARAIAEAYPDPKTMWKVRSGTSHATPLVAGCAVLLREILQSNGCQVPPAALLKAVIINGADKLPGIDIEAQGFGRVNLATSAAMADARPFMMRDIPSSTSISSLQGTVIGEPLKQGAEFVFSLDLPYPSGDSAEPGSNDLQFKITMVYNDLPNAQIQNNLNLSVTDPATGKPILGGLSEDDIDEQNNVEQVMLRPAPNMPLLVRVHAQKTLGDSEQDFALAWCVAAAYKAEEG